VSTAADPPAAAPGDIREVEAQRGARNSLGLGTATALIVGSIIGVGIFNLPASLASYGPISLLAMVLTTVGALGLAYMFAALTSRRATTCSSATTPPGSTTGCR
jgi:APA family basic amino acid/polyamine antiporter